MRGWTHTLSKVCHGTWKFQPRFGYTHIHTERTTRTHTGTNTHTCDCPGRTDLQTVGTCTREGAVAAARLKRPVAAARLKRG